MQTEDIEAPVLKECDILVQNWITTPNKLISLDGGALYVGDKVDKFLWPIFELTSMYALKYEN